MARELRREMHGSRGRQGLGMAHGRFELGAENPPHTSATHVHLFPRGCERTNDGRGAGPRWGAEAKDWRVPSVTVDDAHIFLSSTPLHSSKNKKSTEAGAPSGRWTAANVRGSSHLCEAGTPARVRHEETPGSGQRCKRHTRTNSAPIDSVPAGSRAARWTRDAGQCTHAVQRLPR